MMRQECTAQPCYKRSWAFTCAAAGRHKQILTDCSSVRNFHISRRNSSISSRHTRHTHTSTVCSFVPPQSTHPHINRVQLCPSTLNTPTHQPCAALYHYNQHTHTSTVWSSVPPHLTHPHINCVQLCPTTIHTPTHQPCAALTHHTQHTHINCVQLCPTTIHTPTHQPCAADPPHSTHPHINRVQLCPTAHRKFLFRTRRPVLQPTEIAISYSESLTSDAQHMCTETRGFTLNYLFFFNTFNRHKK